MARVEGTIRLKGTLGGISFYKSKDGSIARAKGGPDKKKISSDPVFERTRENNHEFGACVKAGSLLKHAMLPLCRLSSDHRLTSRINALMFALKELDAVNGRGMRNAGVGLSTPAGKQLLQTFEFNKQAHLSQVLKKAYNLNTGSGTVVLNGLTGSDIVFPPGATHVGLTSGWARIDFVNGVKEMTTSNTVYIARNAAPSTITLMCNAPSLAGTSIFVLQLRFIQEVNTLQYDLNNGEFNCMRVIGVS